MRFWPKRGNAPPPADVPVEALGVTMEEFERLVAGIPERYLARRKLANGAWEVSVTPEGAAYLRARGTP